MKLTALINTCQQLARKATAGENAILRRTLIKPINATGIISKTNITVTPTATGCIIESHLPDYAMFVNYGRRAGKRPPIRSLTDWCRRHGMAGKEWAVATNIAKHGTKGKYFVTPLKRMVGMLVATLPKAVITDILTPKGFTSDLPKTIDL